MIDIDEREIATEIASAKGPEGIGAVAVNGTRVLDSDRKAAKNVLALIRRKEAEQEKRAADGLLTRATINILAPGHDRTSCSDRSVSNGDRNEEGYPRCVRCYLLLRMDMSESLAQIRERVEIRTNISPKYTTKTVEVQEVIRD